MHFLRKRNSETGTGIHFGLAQKLEILTKFFKYGYSLAKETHLEPYTGLGLKPDSSKHKFQINFCCKNAKCTLLFQKKMFSKTIKTSLTVFYEIAKSTTTIAFRKWRHCCPFCGLFRNP